MGRFADLLDTTKSENALRPNDKNDISQTSVVSDVTTKTTKGGFGRLTRLVVPRNSFSDALAELEARCPDYVQPERWQQCVADGRQFLATWGDRAAALGWSPSELFGLHQVPPHPAATYQRLSRYDATGLIWLLGGRRVIAMTDSSAAIETAGGGTLTYRRYNKPALGPLGDSLDDMEACR